MKVTETSYVSKKEILFNLDPFTARPLMVSDKNITAVDGKKTVPAGSLLNIAGEIVNDGTARYVLLEDTNVTYGAMNGAGVYKGTINLDKLPVVPSEAAMQALKGIFFMEEADLDYNAGYVPVEGGA